MKVNWGNGGIAPRILDLDTSFKTRPLYPQRKSSWYPMDRRLCGLQSQSGHGSKEENVPSPYLPGTEP